MSSHSATRCRNGHPTVAALTACRTCGAPITVVRAAATIRSPLSSPGASAVSGATRQEIVAMLWTILATIALVGFGVVLVGVASLG